NACIRDFRTGTVQDWEEFLTMNILVTGGAGFIGSHTLIELIAAGHNPVVVDNLSNASPEAIHRVEKIVGQPIPFYEVDIRDREGLEKVFAQHTFDCC